MNGKKLADMFADWLPLDSPERAANFKKWFGDSKAVDFEGNPERLYRGSNLPFDGVDVEQLGKEGAVFFVDNPYVASAYASNNRPQFRTDQGNIVSRGAAVTPVHASLQNPLIVDFQGKDKTTPFTNRIRNAKKAGHDGVIFQNVVDSPGFYDNFFPEANVYAIFDEGKVKSTFNRGTYDPNEKDILKAALPFAAGAGLMSMLPSDAEAVQRIREKDLPLEDAWNPLEAFAGGVPGGLKAAAMGVLPDGAMDWAFNRIGGLMSGGGK